MPSFLYYTDLNDTNYHLKSLDFDNTEYQIRSDKALEMVYRVKTGAESLTPWASIMLVYTNKTEAKNDALRLIEEEKQSRTRNRK